jgi:MFS family permease
LNTATEGLSTSAIYIGGVIAGVTYPRVTDYIGRRNAMLWAALITIIFVVVQTAAVNIAMFTVARIMIGYGTAASSIAGPTYVAETLPYNWRGWGLGLMTDFYYVGESKIQDRIGKLVTNW